MPGAHTILLIVVTIAAFYLYTRPWIRIELVSLLLLVTLLLIFYLFPYDGPGTRLTEIEIFQSFGHPALIAICSLMILVARAHDDGRHGARRPRVEPAVEAEPWLGFLCTLVIAGAASAFINDTPVLVLDVAAAAVAGRANRVSGVENPDAGEFRDPGRRHADERGHIHQSARASDRRGPRHGAHGAVRLHGHRGDRFPVWPCRTCGSWRRVSCRARIEPARARTDATRRASRSRPRTARSSRAASSRTWRAHSAASCRLSACCGTGRRSRPSRQLELAGRRRAAAARHARRACASSRRRSPSICSSGPALSAS